MKKLYGKQKISTKIVIVCLIVSVIPLWLYEYMAFSSLKKADIKESFLKLDALRNNKSAHISDYLKGISAQIKTFSNSRTVIQAMGKFKDAYRLIEEEAAANSNKVEESRKRIENFFKTEYLPKLNNNLETPFSLNQCMSSIPASLILQDRFLSSNPNPTGSKDQLADAGDGSRYSEVHKSYHPILRDYLKEFGYYDIFLVDHETGIIIYSVYKEADYATSLYDGPYKDTNLALSVKKAAKINSEKELVFEDFMMYKPSYSAEAAFKAKPIFDKGKKIGVLVFQIPVSKINKIMTNDEDWKAAGLGKSGECYLVGSDHKLRTESRFWLEDKEGLISLLEEKGEKPATIRRMRSMDSTLGLMDVRSETIELALGGETGESIVNDYRGERVLSAYAPLDVEGIHWAILCDIEEEEAVASAYELLQQMMLVMIILVVLIVLFALFMSKTIAHPLVNMQDVLEEAVDNADLTARMDVVNEDEVGWVAASVNSFLGRLQELLKDIFSNTESVSAASVQLSSTSEELANTVESQKAQTDEIVVSVRELTTTSAEIAESIEHANSSTEKSSELTKEGSKTIENSLASLNSIAGQTEVLASSIKNLNTSSEKIGGIVGVINDVADQTNLLALNAAIEAARAGEAGRGFAVVADEVRKLAERTSKATGEIGHIISALQSEARDADRAMNDALGEVEKGTKLGEESLAILEQIVESGLEVMEQMASIAAAINEENAAIDNINTNAQLISDAVAESSTAVEEVARTSEQFAEDAEVLKDKMEIFKT